MVVLAAAICTKNGKALLSRQFSEMTKSRVEGLLAAFPKLIGLGRQHTFIETENIRYVYQPLESLYIVLITNKNSNILEDLETLHLLAKLVPEYSNFDEYDISKNAFELVFTFDEVIAMGYKERVTLQQIKHFISMESHEEERFRMEEKIKQKEAQILASSKAKEIERIRHEEMLKGRRSGYGGMGGGGMGSGGYSPLDSSPYGGSGKSSPYNSGGMGNNQYGGGNRDNDNYNNNNNNNNNNNRDRDSPSTSRPSAASSGLQGMKLGGKSGLNKNSAIAQVLKEEKIVEKVEDVEQLLDSQISQIPETPTVPQEGVHITVEESFTSFVESDGTVESIDIKGGLSVQVNDQSLGKVKVNLKQGKLSKQFQFITHPNIDKALFGEQSVLRLKDGIKGFPGGGILKWRCKTNEESMMPIRVNCWPSPGRDSTTVNLEYDCLVGYELKSVFIVIPNPTSNAPIINQFDGLYEYDNKQKCVIWKIPLIDDSNRQGSMEFSVKGNTQSFFPVKIQFTASHTICDTIVGSVFVEETNQSTNFSTETTLSVDTYEIK
ncbi:hypothetical protein ACTFIV_001018 [Dictyostelium citrinum]